MAKYDPLADHLRRSPHDRVRLTFGEVGAILGDTLPQSAHDHAAWWSFEADPRPVQKVAWTSAGFEVDSVNRDRQVVVFRRTR